jgi:hypothetical protein
MQSDIKRLLVLCVTHNVTSANIGTIGYFVKKLTENLKISAVYTKKLHKSISQNY